MADQVTELPEDMALEWAELLLPMRSKLPPPPRMRFSEDMDLGMATRAAAASAVVVESWCEEWSSSPSRVMPTLLSLRLMLQAEMT